MTKTFQGSKDRYEVMFVSFIAGGHCGHLLLSSQSLYMSWGLEKVKRNIYIHVTNDAQLYFSLIL